MSIYPLPRRAFLALPLTLLGCAPLPDTYPGDVTSFNGYLVEIQAPVTGTGDLSPTSAMQTQADQLCGRAARFLNRTLDQESVGTTTWTPFGPITSSPSLYPTNTFRFSCQ